MIHLKSIRLNIPEEKADHFPFSIPVIRDFENMELESPVTLLVGENGSGKSTFIEALAVGVESIAVGEQDISRDPTLEHARTLGKCFRLSWKKRVRRGFFMRAEDFFSFIKRAGSLRQEMEELEAKYDRELSGYGKLLATGAARGEMLGVQDRYGVDPDACSHGESFINFFEARLVPEGLYLLDEPEVPLSPQRQLSLMYIIHEFMNKGCQFIIATHSPLLLSFPGADIYSFDETPPAKKAYEDLDHVNFTRNFLNSPEAYLRHLLK